MNKKALLTTLFLFGVLLCTVPSYSVITDYVEDVELQTENNIDNNIQFSAILQKKAFIRLKREKRKNLKKINDYNNSEFEIKKTNLAIENKNKNNVNSSTNFIWWKNTEEKPTITPPLITSANSPNWWEKSPNSENFLQLKNIKTKNSNWWEKPQEQNQINDVPWWLDSKNTKEYDKFLQTTEIPETDYDITLFDLYLGDTQVGLALVNYTDKWFTIPEPNDLLEQLSGVKSPSKLLALLNGKIPNYRNIKGIGDIALERDSFKLLLNVDKRNLTSTQLALNKLVENPVNKFSLENRVSFMTSGNIDEHDSSNTFAHKTLASYGKQFLLAHGYVDDENKYELQELNLGTIIDKYSIKGGFLQNRGNTFVPSLNILGMKIETEEQLFLDSDLTKGSKLEIFIPSTAKVLFYRNDVLLDYQILNYGLQEIDTTRFPQGSYQVDIEIREYNGKVTKESQFFTKSGLLASRDRPIYYASAGSGRDKTDIIEIPVLEAGFRVRANDHLETENSVFATESISVASATIKGLWNDYYLSLGGGVSNEGDIGLNTTLNTTFKNTFFNISWTEIPGDNSFANEYTSDSNKDKFLYTASSIKNKRRTISGNIQRGYKNVTYGVQGSFTTNTKRDKEYTDTFDENFFLVTNDTYAVGPWMHIKLLHGATQSLDFKTNYYFKKRDNSFNAQLQYNKRLSEHVYNNSSLNFNNEDSKFLKLANSLSYNGLNSTTNTGLDASLDTELTNYDNTDSIPVNNNLKLTYGNPYVYTTGNLNNQFYKSDSNTTYGGSIQSSMILTEDGFGRIMTPQRSNSMVIINIVDNDSKKNNNSIFSVIINDMKYTEVKANTPSLVALSPYKTYKIRIESTEESDLTEYDNKSKVITLFPGNIGEVSWKIKKVFVGIGTIVDENGEPLKHQKIKGVSNYVYTEEDGSFQANLTGKEKLYIKSSNYDCKISLPKQKTDDVVVDFGKLVCK